MSRSDEFRSGGQFPERMRHPPGDPFHVPEGHSVTTFGAIVKNKPASEIDMASVISPHWHGGKHVATHRMVTTQDEYSGNVMHHALVTTKDHWGQTNHNIIHMQADGTMLNSMGGGLPELHREMDNYEHGTDNPTGSVFDPLPRGYEDKYGKAREY